MTIGRGPRVFAFAVKPHRLATRDLWLVATLVVAFAAAYAVYGLFRHWHYDSSAYDMGIFDQVVWHLSRFETPATTVRGHSNMMGDHFSPVLALLAPLYWIAPRPEALIVGQAALLGLSIVPVFVYARRRLSSGLTCAVAIAYGLFWGMQRAAEFDFHEVAFAPLVIATAILALDEERWPLFWTMALVLIGVKEDLIPLVGGFGLLLLVRGRLRQGLAVIAVSCIAFAVVIGVVIPRLSDAGEFGYIGPYTSAARSPWRIPLVLVTPVMKLRTTLLMFAPFAFLPLLSPLTILIAPVALVRFLSSSPNHWGTAFHYWAPIAPVLAMGAADGLDRVAGSLRHQGHDARNVTMRVFAAACVVLSAFLPTHQPMLRLVRLSTYDTRPVAQTGNLVVGLIPKDASVVAQGAIVPHLSDRERIFVLDGMVTDAEFLVATDRLDPWPLGSHDELRSRIDDHRTRGYRPVFERDGWIVLRRPPGRGPPPPRE